jgi:pantetheine-phosphate adenylyltransferase
LITEEKFLRNLISELKMIKKYKLIALGGTFDNLHKGHKELFKKAFAISKKVIIGITSDEYILKNKTKGIASYKEREKLVKNFLHEKNIINHSKIIKLDDMFGETIVNKKIDSIIVSKCTLPAAEEINRVRAEKNIPELSIIVSEYFLAKDGLLISSKRIRDGQIGRSGDIYLNKEWLKKDLILPKTLRVILKKPFGKIVSDKELVNFQQNMATVGDRTTQKLNEFFGNQKISIVDLLVNRKKAFLDLKELKFRNKREVIKISNPPGMITTKLFKVIQKSFTTEGKKTILIKGEEDLAVLPLIIFAPLNFQIFYGQPGKGLVKIVVNEAAKKRAQLLLSKFKFRVE